MKCPKCGYHSYEYLENCRKCGQDLAEHKSRFNLGSFNPPPKGTEDPPAEKVESAAPASAMAGESNDIDFGFDFLDEEDESETSAQTSEFDQQKTAGETFNISQPFNIEGETVPADELSKQKKK